MKAYQRALEKQDNILYKKVGRKYIQINDMWA